VGLISLPWDHEPGIQLSPELSAVVRAMIEEAATTAPTPVPCPESVPHGHSLVTVGHKRQSAAGT
jgi:hypothetical protein